MSDSKFQPGQFVRHKDLGVGRIESVDGNPAVVFWSDRDSGKSQTIPAVFLKLLPSDSPEILLWEEPESLATWAEDAPLKLVASTLSLSGGTGGKTDILGKLAGLIPGVDWDGWWKKTQPKIRKEPEHFEISKSGKDSQYTLRTSAKIVPVVDVSKPAKRAVKQKTGQQDRMGRVVCLRRRRTPSRSDRIPGQSGA